MTVAETDAAAATAVYVYGVTPAGASPRFDRGVADARVALVEHGELAAITSSVGGHLRAKRRDLLRHSDVLQTAFAKAPVLPFRFGTVLASDEAVVEELLAPRYEELVGLLHEVEGLCELRIRAAFVEAALLAEVIRDDRRIADLREQTRTAPESDPRRVQLGEAVARAVAARQAAAADEIVGTLAPLARDVVVEERREELEVARASFLVELGAVSRFERAAESLAARQRGVLETELVGPMPPHSFVHLRPGKAG